MNITSNVLLHCRHKGAIESSGPALGKIVKSITQNSGADSKMFEIVTSCVEKIFDVIDKTDTTRRGAGFSIMVLHLVKNDCSKDKVHNLSVLSSTRTYLDFFFLGNRETCNGHIIEKICISRSATTRTPKSR